MKSVAERFWPKVEKTWGCWIWTAGQDGRGYGQFNFNRKPTKAHRVSFMLTRGEIPQGLDLDHLCRNRLCVNPDHLEPVTRGENVRRGEAGLATGAKNRAKTHCPKGHPLSGENLYERAGRRACRTCRNAAVLRYQARKKEATK